MELEWKLESKQAKTTKIIPMLESHIVPQQALGVKWALVME